jgi:hypothetical protein
LSRSIASGTNMMLIGMLLLLKSHSETLKNGGPW